MKLAWLSSGNADGTRDVYATVESVDGSLVYGGARPSELECMVEGFRAFDAAAALGHEPSPEELMTWIRDQSDYGRSGRMKQEAA